MLNNDIDHLVYLNFSKNNYNLAENIEKIVSSTPSEIYNDFLKKGAVLFRGFEIDSESKFNDLMCLFADKIISYTDGNSPRTKISNLVYTSTEYPKEYEIKQHNELSYSYTWPRFLLFYCLQPSIKGGQTPLADCRKILTDMPLEIVQNFQKKQLKYIRNLTNKTGWGKSWQDTFETDNKSQVEKICKENHTVFTWLPDDHLRLEQIGPVTIQHPITNEIVWFNQPSQFHPAAMPASINNALKVIYGDNPFDYPHHVVYGDNTELLAETLDNIQDITERHTKYFSWQKGDILLIDNILVSHGRRPYEGSRKVLVSCFK